MNFEAELERRLTKYDIKNKYDEIIFLCVGTNKVIGDSVGPIVGTKLIEEWKENKIKKIHVYGTLEKTLNFKNANNVITQISLKHQNPFIITIDAALSDDERMGQIYINEGIIELGSSLGKCIKCNSNINIKAVVGKYDRNPNKNIKTLKNVDSKRIMQISQNIIEGINRAVSMSILKY